MAAIFTGPVEGRDYDEMPARREATVPTTAPELLEASAQRMLTVGHHRSPGYIPKAYRQGPLDDAPCCALAAIRISAGLNLDDVETDHDDQPPIVHEAERLLGELVIRTTGTECVDPSTEVTDYQETIAGWSDSETNCAESIADAMRDAAEMGR
jgi:hypothetical protein